MAVAENIWATSDHAFYIPSEVNGQPASSLKAGERLNAHAALYDTESLVFASSDLDIKEILRDVVEP